MSNMMSRAACVDMFGPTTGDRIRLAGTGLIVEVERDFTTYGEEAKFGGGKAIRDGMGQSQRGRAAGAVDPETCGVRADGALLTCEPATVLPMVQRYFIFQPTLTPAAGMPRPVRPHLQ